MNSGIDIDLTDRNYSQKSLLWLCHYVALSLIQPKKKVQCPNSDLGQIISLKQTVHTQSHGSLKVNTA